MHQTRLIRVLLATLLLLGLTAAVSLEATPEDHGLVELIKVNPHIIIDLKYATTDNFLHAKVYDDGRCFVLKPLAAKLDQAQKLLSKDGLGLKIYDGYRPYAVQKKMWALMPDARYVADPNKGGSIHNRGAAVDLTLVDAEGNELPMPTPFDTFTPRAAAYSLEPSAQERANRMLLRTVMQKVGLVGINTEWWHFQLPDGKKYPII
ncbi:MAG: D-alanyl-D-alanine dipeptidase [Firmicutes bacterium]|nr:D-alanyl-D-alanine dipeptidase [Bacillota bacterium]